MNALHCVGRGILAAAVLATMTVVQESKPAAAAEVAIGAGSSFSALIVSQWRADAAASGIQINYQDTGSTQGRTLFLQAQVDFAMSDIPFQRGELESGKPERRNFRYITLVAGAMAFAFNLKDLNGQRVLSLNLTPRAVCRLFTEKDIKWNDPEIQQLNPQVGLPSSPVVPVIRQDGSGTTYVLMEYCIATSPQIWAAFIARVGNADSEFAEGKPLDKFPEAGSILDQRQPLSSGVAKFVANNSTGPNSITYVEAGTAEGFDLPMANMSSLANPTTFVKPSPGAITRALAFADPDPSTGTFRLDFTGNDPQAYFPSSYSYMIVQTAGMSADKGESLAKFLYYALGSGQRRNERLIYARLSQKLIDDALKVADTLPGSPGRTSNPTTTTTTTTRPQGTTTTVAGATTTVAAGGSAASTTRPVTPAPGATTTTAKAGAAGPGVPTTRAVVVPGSPTTALTSVTVPGSGSIPDPDPFATTLPFDVTDPLSTAPAELIENPPIDPGTGEVPSDDGSDAGAGLGADAPSEAVQVAGPIVAGPAAELPSKPGPSNADAVFTLLQGAAIVGAGLMLNRARTKAAA